MEIKYAHTEDLIAIARCHRHAFPSAFSSRLGERYLTRMYGWYLTNPSTFLVYLQEDENLVGYVGGILRSDSKQSGSASGMTQYAFVEGVRALSIRPWLLMHPDFISRLPFLWKNLRRRLRPRSGTGGKLPPARSTESNCAGLVVIAVDPRYQGRGYGSHLLRIFEETARERGYSRLRLSVKSTNSQAIRTYTNNGWRIDKRNGDNVEMWKG